LAEAKLENHAASSILDFGLEERTTQSCKKRCLPSFVRRELKERTTPKQQQLFSENCGLTVIHSCAAGAGCAFICLAEGFSGEASF
jgi:hypothetical protein